MSILVSAEASRGAGPQRMTVSVTGCGFDSREAMFRFSSLWCRGKVRR